MGGLDIYSVKINGSRIEGDVSALPYPINSAGDDFGYFPLNAECGLFASNRAGGHGMDDIFMCKPVPFVLTAKGKVTDKTTGLPIAKALVIVKLNGEVTDTTMTDANGEYLISNILCDKTYQIDAVKEGYIPQTKTLVTIGEKKTRELSSATGHNIDFELFRITRDEITINNIYYDFDKWDLREESKRELDKIVELLNENPGMRIQLNSHTDDRGTDVYNMDLSQKRAQSVVEYLIQQGIDQKRLLFKGWGETKLLITNAQTEEEHQMNRRTTFNILNAGDYGDEYYENLYAEIDKGIQKSRAHMFFRIFFGTKGETAFDQNFDNIRQWFPGTDILTVKEDGLDRYYMGSYIFMDEAMDVLTQLKNKGLTDCYIAAFRDENKIGVVKLQ
jgi:outer membrane protein OmpA-like peptidoglycan-associated protein